MPSSSAPTSGPSRGAAGSVVARSAALSRDALPAVRRLLSSTPLRPALGIEPGGELLLKLESFQPTGSFKVRGACARIALLSDAERAAGVVAASTGNHGAAVAFAAAEAGVAATVVVPERTAEGRVRAIEARGAEVLRFGEECGAAEVHARGLAESSGRAFLSPYNDEAVMAGQGTLGLELLEETSELRRVYVAAGGGGLIGGVASALKDAGSGVEVVGCSPAADHPLHASVAAGHVVDPGREATLSVATAGALEVGSVTLAPCAEAVDRWELVSESEIASATYALIASERLMVEGAVGVALAVWQRDRAAGRAPGTSCVVVCGGNLDVEHLRTVLSSQAEAAGGS